MGVATKPADMETAELAETAKQIWLRAQAEADRAVYPEVEEKTYRAECLYYAWRKIEDSIRRVAEGVE